MIKPSLCLFQVVLINAVRDVAKALAELISATKCAAGKAADDPSMYQLKSAAKVCCMCVRKALCDFVKIISCFDDYHCVCMCVRLSSSWPCLLFSWLGAVFARCHLGVWPQIKPYLTVIIVCI